MKYAFRKGMFETNSSSTHSMVLYVDGKDGDGNAPSHTPLDADFLEGEREVRSRRMKLLLLYQFKYQDFVDCNCLFDELVEEVKSGHDIDTAFRLQQFGNDYVNLEIFREHLIKALGDDYDDEAKLIIENIEKDIRYYMPACLECFWNDVLQFCDCGIGYVYICDRFNVAHGNIEDELTLIEKILKDDVFFVVTECWMGGETFDIPSIL